MMQPGKVPMNAEEMRVGEDGRVAQLFPLGVFPEPGRRWLCMSAPEGLLTATLLTDEEVDGWRVVWRADA